MKVRQSKIKYGHLKDDVFQYVFSIELEWIFMNSQWNWILEETYIFCTSEASDINTSDQGFLAASRNENGSSTPSLEWFHI